MKETKYSYMEFLDNLEIPFALKAILYEEYLRRETYWKSLIGKKPINESHLTEGR